MHVQDAHTHDGPAAPAPRACCSARVSSPRPPLSPRAARRAHRSAGRISRPDDPAWPGRRRPQSPRSGCAAPRPRPGRCRTRSAHQRVASGPVSVCLEPVRSSLAIRLPHNPLTNSTGLPPGSPPPCGAELVLYASGRRALQSVAVDLLTLLDLDPRGPCWTGTWHYPTWPTPPTPWPPSPTTAARSSVASASCSPAAYPWTRAGRNSPGVPPPTGTIFLQPPVSSCAHSPHPPPALHQGTTAATRDDRPRQPVRSPDRPPPGFGQPLRRSHRLSAAATTTCRTPHP